MIGLARAQLHSWGSLSPESLMSITSRPFSTLLVLAFVLVSVLFCVTVTAQEKQWPYYFDTSSYSYREFGSFYQIRVYNMPVSEGSSFLLDLDFSGLEINRDRPMTVVEPFDMLVDDHGNDLSVAAAADAAAAEKDFLKIDVVTQFWPDNTGPVRRSTTIVAPITGTSSKGIPIEFPQHKTPYVAASSHQFIITVPTNRIADHAAIDIRLTKVSTDATKLVFVMAKPFGIPGYSAPAFSSFKLDLRQAKTKKVTKYERPFTFTLSGSSKDIPLTTTVFAVTTGGAGLVTKNLGSATANPCKMQVNKLDPVDVDFNDTTTPGSLTFVPPASSPVLTEKDTLKIWCPDRYVVYTKSAAKKPLAWTFSATLAKVDKQEVPTTISNSVRATPLEKDSSSSAFGFFFLLGFAIIVGVVLFFLWKRHNKRKKEMGLMTPTRGTADVALVDEHYS